MQGWLKAPTGEPIGEGESTLVGNLGSPTNDGGWALKTRNGSASNFGRLSFWVGEVEFTENHAIRILSDQVYTETDEWVFFAMTYSTSGFGDVTFYRGTTDDTVVQAGSGLSDILIDNQIALSNRSFYIGNGGNEGGEWFQGRAFNGMLDNIRVYDRVLDMNELEQLRLTDLAPTLGVPGDFDGNGIPGEPSDYAAWLASDGTIAGYQEYKASIGSVGSGSIASRDANSIPEPASCFLLVVAVLLTMIRTRTSSRL